MNVQVVDNKGKKVEQIELSDSVFGVVPNEEALKQYVRIYLTNQREGNASTKTKAEVSGGGRKPWKQKGTGHARQGSIRSPQWRHGGVAHGPKSKDWRLDIPAQLKVTALLSALASKFTTEGAVVLNDFKLESPKTAEVQALLNGLSLSKNKVLLVLPKSDRNVVKSAANIQKIAVSNVLNLNAYEVLNAKKVIFTKEAVLNLESKYTSEAK